MVCRFSVYRSACVCGPYHNRDIDIIRRKRSKIWLKGLKPKTRCMNFEKSVKFVA